MIQDASREIAAYIHAEAVKLQEDRGDSKFGCGRDRS